MPNGLIPELISEIAIDFAKHLAIENNSRILFSGRFGKGKTTFLEEYFKEESPYNNSGLSYKVFHLKPVNYSVASNEDIFKYIKYDIILEFLRKNVDVESYDFSFLNVLPNYVLGNPLKIIRPFIEYIPKVGKLLDEFIKKLEKMYEEVKDKAQNINKNSESDILADFLEKLEQNEYSIYENDVTTKVIGKILSDLKNSNSESKPTENILIIDDLDRIDPEHIFRVLNIFSAHFDNHYTIFGKENKFGFDKVVLVCDADNIRNIFKNKYGADVDFKGYIDKFYSTEIFSFSNYNQLISATRNIVSKIKIKLGYHDFVLGSGQKSIIFLVAPLIYQNILSFRRVILVKKISIIFKESYLFIDDDISANLERNSILVDIKFFIELFGSSQDFMEALMTLEKANAPITNLQSNFNNLIYVYAYRFHKFRANAVSLIINDVFEKQIFVSLQSSENQWNSLTYTLDINNETPFEYEPRHYYRLLTHFCQRLIVRRTYD